MDMRFLLVVVGVLVMLFGLPVLVALGPLWVIVLAAFGLFWAYSKFLGDDE